MPDTKIEVIQRSPPGVALTIGGRHAASETQARAFRRCLDALGDRPDAPSSREPARPGSHGRAGAAKPPAGEQTPDPEKDAADAQAAGFEAGHAEGRQAGYDAGWDAGHAAGRDAGYAAGLAEGREAAETAREAERAGVEAIRQALQRPLESLRSELADLVAEGAERVARHIVNGALSIDRTLLRHTLGEVLDEAAADNTARARLQLRVAPADRDTAEQLVAGRDTGDLPVEIIEDNRLSAGEVHATRIHENGDPANQVDWDARLDTRWQKIRETLISLEN